MSWKDGFVFQPSCTPGPWRVMMLQCTDSRQDVNTPLLSKGNWPVLYILLFYTKCQDVNRQILAFSFLVFGTSYILLKRLKLHWYVYVQNEEGFCKSFSKTKKSRSSHWQKTTHLALNKKAIVLSFFHLDIIVCVKRFLSRIQFHVVFQWKHSVHQFVSWESPR